jgi:hypothetical protein
MGFIGVIPLNEGAPPRSPFKTLNIEVIWNLAVIAGIYS